MSVLIDVGGLRYRYGRAGALALDDLSLSVRAGSLFGLLGPNGSGKTTLISILAGVRRAQSGSVRIADQDVSRSGVRAGVALVPQEYAFYPSLTVAENLQFFAGIQRLARADRAERIAHALTIAGLESATARRGDALSGGMKRRLNLALGLLNRPQLLLLDEPTVGIDPQSRAFILDAITGINRSGTTVVYTSHYMEEVEAICDDIAVIDHGKLLAQGALPALLARMPHRRLRLDFAAPLTEAQHAALCAVEPLRVTANSAVADHCSADAYGQVMATVRSEHVALSRVQYGHTSLEDLFLDLTTRRLRDE